MEQLKTIAIRHNVRVEDARNKLIELGLEVYNKNRSVMNDLPRTFRQGRTVIPKYPLFVNFLRPFRNNLRRGYINLVADALGYDAELSSDIEIIATVDYTQRPLRAYKAMRDRMIRKVEVEGFSEQEVIELLEGIWPKQN